VLEVYRRQKSETTLLSNQIGKQLEDCEEVNLFHVLRELNGSVDALANQGVALVVGNFKVNKKTPIFCAIP
jgi:hypothetical protein